MQTLNSMLNFEKMPDAVLFTRSKFDVVLMHRLGTRRLEAPLVVVILLTMSCNYQQPQVEVGGCRNSKGCVPVVPGGCCEYAPSSGNSTSKHYCGC